MKKILGLSLLFVSQIVSADFEIEFPIVVPLYPQQYYAPQYQQYYPPVQQYYVPQHRGYYSRPYYNNNDGGYYYNEEREEHQQRRRVLAFWENNH
jgi:hypothetical protein